MRKSILPLRRVLPLLAGAIILTLGACAPAAPVPTPTVNVTAIYTQAYQTYTAEEATESATASATPAATVGVPNTGATAGIPNTGGVTAVPGAGQLCSSSVYISDVTIPDGTIVAPGQSLVKTWRIMNNGSCEWTPQYRLAFVGGTNMGVHSVALGTRVRPGKELSMTVDLTAPLTPGNYTGSYELQDVRGRVFGNVFTIVITVTGSAAMPTSTATPTMTPASTPTP